TPPLPHFTSSFTTLLNSSIAFLPTHLTRNSLLLLSSTMAGSSSTPDPWLNPFPTGKGWVAMLLGSSCGDQDLFLNYVKVAMRYTSPQGLIAATDAVRKKTITEEMQRMVLEICPRGNNKLVIIIFL
ncbi:hypothetical protein ZWY2020_046706, partial [Hordeum vulgare]